MNDLAKRIQTELYNQIKNGNRPSTAYLGHNELISILSDRMNRQHIIFMDNNEKDIFGLRIIEVNLDNHLRIY